MRLSFFAGTSAGAHRLVRQRFAAIVDFRAKANSTSLSGRMFASDAGQFLRPRVQSNGGIENGFGRPLLRSPRGLGLCTKCDRLF